MRELLIRFLPLRRLHHPLLCCISLSPTLVTGYPSKETTDAAFPITHPSRALSFSQDFDWNRLDYSRVKRLLAPSSSPVQRCTSPCFIIMGTRTFVLMQCQLGTVAPQQPHLYSPIFWQEKWLGWIWVAMISSPALCWLLGFPLTNRALSIRFSVHEPRKRQQTWYSAE